MSQFDPKFLYLVTPKPNETAEEFNQRAEEELRLREMIYEEEKRRRAEEQNREMRERARWSTKREPQTPEERKAALIRDAEMYNATREMMQQITNSQREKRLIQQLEQQQLERQKLEQQELKQLLEEEMARQSQQQPQQQQPYSYNPLSLLKGLKTRVSGLLPGKRGVNGGKLSVGKRSSSKKGKKSQKSQKSRRHSRHSKRK